MIRVTSYERKQQEYWDSWSMWRYSKGITEDDSEVLEFRDPEPPSFCATCSGKGRLFIDTFEGMVPSSDCPTCKGTGTA